MKTKSRKRFAAAAIVVLSLLAAGCGSSAKDEHAQHGTQNETQNETEAPANEHSGHNKAAENAEGNEAAEGHNGHDGAAGMTDADVKLEWRYSPESPKPGEETEIELFLYDAAGKPIEKYDINHEKMMHLIVVRDDMTEFMHIHPKYEGKGKFEVAAVFAKSGSYKLFADFIPTGSPQMTVTSRVKVSGTEQGTQPLVKDASLSKVVDGIAASLKISTYKAGQPADLTFTFSDDKTKEPITDLQPYLGAIGHVVILSEDLKRYLHVHPQDGNGSGPNAEFTTTFPEPGLYKIWGQFQRGDKTFIIPFTIEAE